MAVRMRFAAQAYEELRKDDPGTRVTLSLIRTLVRRGDIPSIKVGRGRLLNYDALLAYLETSMQQAPNEDKPDGYPLGIRPIDERAQL